MDRLKNPSDTVKSYEDRDFPGGPVVKNLPSNAGNVDLIPGQGSKIPTCPGASVEPTHQK